MALSIQKQWELVFLWLHRLGPKLSIRSIAKELNCAVETVHTWIHQYQETGDVQDILGWGLKCKTSEAEDTKIIATAKRLRTGSLADISTILNKQGTSISLTTIQRRLNEQGFYKLQPLQKPLLTDTHWINRLKWAKAHKNNNWTNVIFTDETSFSQFSKPKKVWRQKGEIIKVPTVKHSMKVHVYGCFSEKGFGKIHCFTNNLNGELLCSIYKHTLVPSAITFFGKGKNKWILQEDNDPKHRSIKAQK